MKYTFWYWTFLWIRTILTNKNNNNNNCVIWALLFRVRRFISLHSYINGLSKYNNFRLSLFLTLNTYENCPVLCCPILAKFSSLTLSYFEHVLKLSSIILSHFSSCAVQAISFRLRCNVTETNLHFLLHSSSWATVASVSFLFVNIKILFLKNWGVFHICFFCAKKKQNVVLLRKNQYLELFLFLYQVIDRTGGHWNLYASEVSMKVN